MALVRRLVKGQALTGAEYDGNVDHFEQNPNGIYMPKSSATGMELYNTTPGDGDFGWHDLRSDITLTGDASDPSYVTYIGNIKQLQFNVGDAVNITFHLPHDYKLGTDVFIHIHWSHNSATITGGTVSGFFEASYSKGHNQAAFANPVVLNLTNIPASLVRYQHVVTEGQLSAAAGAGGLLVTEDLEPDGVILCRLEMTANTMDGGAIPFVHQIDVHYQSTNLPTIQKAPDFYT